MLVMLGTHRLKLDFKWFASLCPQTLISIGFSCFLPVVSLQMGAMPPAPYKLAPGLHSWQISPNLLDAIAPFFFNGPDSTAEVKLIIAHPGPILTADPTQLASWMKARRRTTWRLVFLGGSKQHLERFIIMMTHRNCTGCSCNRLFLFPKRADIGKNSIKGCISNSSI